MAFNPIQPLLSKLQHCATQQLDHLASPLLHRGSLPVKTAHSLPHESFCLDILGSNDSLSNFVESLRTIQRRKQEERDGKSSPPAGPCFVGIAFTRLQKRSKALTSNVEGSVVNTKDIEVAQALSPEEEAVVDGLRNVQLENSHPIRPRMIEEESVHIQLRKKMEPGGGPVTKEELGRAAWTVLHTLAAQFPDNPTKQQQRDVKELMAIISRIYPCKECADHFKEVLKTNPVQAGSGFELGQWMCKVHNIVNRSLGKPIFPCQRVDARWGALDCDEGACDLQGRMYR